VTDITAAFNPGEGTELLALAEEIGRIGVIVWQVPEGTVRLSPSALAIYGLKEFDGRYESWIATVYREDVIRLRDTIAKALETRVREFELDFRIVRPSDNELRWIQARRLVFYDAAGKPVRVVGVSVDITEAKRATAQLRAFTETLEEAVKERTRELIAENEARQKAETLLRQSQKMEAVGQLTGGIAHDFNNLLTIILGGLDIIGRRILELEASPATEQIVRAKDMVSQGAQRAVELINRLLAFSRQQALEPRAIDANRLLAEVGELLRRTLGETVSLETVMAGGLWRTFADANQLENALLNLALNARDAMPNGGKMTIETANCYLDEAYVHLLAEPLPPGQYVLIAVADNGLGIDPATLERVFDPFFTTKEVGKGTGLGLSQVYGFVRQSAGHVKIYSELGQGTTIKIYLPRYFGKEQHVKEQVVRGTIPRAIGTEAILVVEDDEALRAYAIETLRELGYRVLGASNGASALEILDREQNVDLLFTDIVMPGGVNGRELAEEAVRRHPKLKVLFTTGYTRNAIVHHGRLDPGVHLINKPFSLDELDRRVRALLDGAQG
jgi:signal transduction histidine kinase/CheY-like chemotaxis protein